MLELRLIHIYWSIYNVANTQKGHALIIITTIKKKNYRFLRFTVQASDQRKESNNRSYNDNDKKNNKLSEWHTQNSTYDHWNCRNLQCFVRRQHQPFRLAQPFLVGDAKRHCLVRSFACMINTKHLQIKQTNITYTLIILILKKKNYTKIKNQHWH